MPKEVDGVIYFSRIEAMAEMDNASASRFNRSIKPYLTESTFDKKKKKWYPAKQVYELKIGKTPRLADITLNSGVFSDWTGHLKGLGYIVDTQDCTIMGQEWQGYIIPKDTAIAFGLDPKKQYIQRSRQTLAGKPGEPLRPICWWFTAYPHDLVKGEILDEMKSLKNVDVVKRIQEKHNLTVSYGDEIVSARNASLEEQIRLDLVDDDAVLIVERTAYAENGTLLFYTYMVLLGSYFTHRSSYKSDPKIWN
jgi:hypothetical protein